MSVWFLFSENINHSCSEPALERAMLIVNNFIALLAQLIGRASAMAMHTVGSRQLLDIPKL